MAGKNCPALDHSQRLNPARQEQTDTEVDEQNDLRIEIEDTMAGTELDPLLGVYHRGMFDRDLQEFTTQSAAAGNP